MFGKTEASWVPDLHRTSSHLRSPYSRPIAWSLDPTAECRRAFGEVLRPLALGHRCHRCHHFWRGYGAIVVGIRVCLLLCLWRELKGVLRICGDSGDGDDGHLRAYSTQGALLYLVGPYPFTLTRRTRRAEQGVPYLLDLWGHLRCRVCLISLTTRRRYPTTDHLCRRVCREHRRVSN